MRDGESAEIKVGVPDPSVKWGRGLSYSEDSSHARATRTGPSQFVGGVSSIRWLYFSRRGG